MKVSLWDRELALGHGEAVEGRICRCGKSQTAVTEEGIVGQEGWEMGVRNGTQKQLRNGQSLPGK